MRKEGKLSIGTLRNYVEGIPSGNVEFGDHRNLTLLNL